eukprot:500297_1
MEFSTLITILYFSIYTLFLLSLGFYVYISGEYDTIKSRSFFKDVWAQRKIYGPILIYFYDTATDIGVVVSWYYKRQEEQSHKYDYYSLDMNVFFWCGVSFLLLYRVVTLIVAIMDIFDAKLRWYDYILILLDLYIFRTIYNSFEEAKKVMQENAEKRRACTQRPVTVVTTSSTKPDLQPVVTTSSTKPDLQPVVTTSSTKPDLQPVVTTSSTSTYNLSNLEHYR